MNDGETLRYLARTFDCRGCLFKAQCCPKAAFRIIPRSIYEEARDVARTLRGPRGAQFEFTMAAIAQNLRRLAKLVVQPPPAAQICCA
jgi:hypothetical protein